jgi:putative membrane-bound dehydrogenase-like protein
MSKTRSLNVIALAAVAGALASTPASAQQAIPARGTVSHDTDREQRLVQQVQVPDNFAATLFAGPPVAMYPTCLTTAADGAVFVCVDPNLSLSADPGKGRVVRLVDRDNDGSADEYTVFAEMDSPRGVVVDGNTLYVMHPPSLTAYRDTDGDGIADETEELVSGLGFGLDFRGADHTTNGITMGIDGWLYVAVGDYGFLEAVGKDGNRITRRGGSVVRVRPDGTGLEIHTVGTRNIYDVAIDPFMHIFSRDNTNDGDGWNTRLHYLPALADMGYPTRYRNFADELMPSLEDYGGGSGTGGLWIQDPGFPEGYDNTLYTADWTVNKVLRHPLTRQGSSFDAEQEDFIALPRPSDLAMDSRSNLYIASLSGGSFRYDGDSVGYVVRVTHTSKAGDEAPQLGSLDEQQLLNVLTDFNATHRLNAQREILRRGGGRDAVRRLEELTLDGGLPAYARVAAMYTLKQLVGERSHETLRRAAADPSIRASALRALADRRDQTGGVPIDLFVQALADGDPFVQMQAINGLVRLGAVDRAGQIVPLTASADAALAHVAVNALVHLGARDAALAALETASPAVRAGALRALQRMHDVATVDGLVARLSRTSDPDAKQRILVALARLSNRETPWEGPYDGGWWGTKPNYTGPYFAPMAWEGSATIGPVLRDALIAASGEQFTELASEFARNRVLPLGAAPLLAAADRRGGPDREAVIGALVGTSTLSPAVHSLLVELDSRGPEMHAAVAQLLAAESSLDPQLIPIVRSAALDATLDAEVRSQLLTAVTRLPEETGLELSIELLSAVTPQGQSAVPDPVEMSWRRFVGDRQRLQQIDRFVTLAQNGTPAERTLAYAVLAQSVRSNRTPAAVRDRVTPVIDAGWTDPASAASLAEAITVMRLESQYAEQLQARSQASRE